MRDTPVNSIVELFGHPTDSRRRKWDRVISEQQCPFLGKKCFKVRKSSPDTSIGTCTLLYGKGRDPIVICPARLLERRQVFTDCFHLLTMHEPGNELHIVREVSVPGGSVDYFLVSVAKGKVKDFVGIEVQTMDTTGTIWPERQRLLKQLGVRRSDTEEKSRKAFGMNWKMTAKTILVQMHHKIRTFEHVNRKLVLIMQDKLFGYMAREFSFGHVSNPAVLGDSMHFHMYQIDQQQDRSFKLNLQSRVSTDVEGIAHCLGMQAEPRIELQQIVLALEAKLSRLTLFKPV